MRCKVSGPLSHFQWREEERSEDELERSASAAYFSMFL